MLVQKNDTPFISMIIVAGGSSTRMGENKLFMDLFGQSVLLRTLKTIDACVLVREIVIVCKKEDIEQIQTICNNNLIIKPVKLVSGGDTRTQSAYKGLLACSKLAKFIGIHDGARPLVTEFVINNVIKRALIKNCAIPVVPVKDTIKIVVDGECSKGLPRDKLYIVQTPQVFNAEIIKECTEKSIRYALNHTDDSSCVEHYSNKVFTVEGDYDNIKITTKDDIALAKLILEKRGLK